MNDFDVERAHAFVRGHSTVDLRFDEHLRELRYTIEPASGRLVAPVMVAMLESDDVVAFVPGYEENSMEIMVTLEPFEETGELGALCDRWLIYHGDPPDVRWARFDIDAARFDGNVIDGEALMRPNPLRDDEARFCRLLNTEHRPALSVACRRCDIDVEEPLAVGIDCWGIDVRRRFDVVRIPLEPPVESVDDIRARLDRLCDHTGAGGEP